MKKSGPLSLQEQLLKSGLTSDAKLKQVKTEKRKQQKQQRTQGQTADDALKHELEEIRRAQAERDKQLNLQRQQAEAQKAVAAQIRQMIEQHQIAIDPNGAPFKFADDAKVKTVYVSADTRAGLVEGRIGIVKQDGAYFLVNTETAAKISERLPDCVVLLNSPPPAPEADDPYAAYKIPDDLLW